MNAVVQPGQIELIELLEKAMTTAVLAVSRTYPAGSPYAGFEIAAFDFRDEAVKSWLKSDR